MRLSRSAISTGEPLLRIHWIRENWKRPACGQPVTSVSTSAAADVTCKKCQAVIRANRSAPPAALTPAINQGNIDRITAELGRHTGDVGETRRLEALLAKREDFMDDVVTVICTCGHLNQFQGVSESLRFFQCSTQENCQKCYKPLDMEDAYIDRQETHSHEPFEGANGRTITSY